MRSLPAAVTALAALAVAVPAQGSDFTAPRTLADWGPGGEVLAAAPGAAAWTHPTGLRISRDGGAPARIPGAGLVQDVGLASAGGEPVAGWVDSEMRLHAFAGRETIVAGTMERVRKVAATPSALAWIGDGPGSERKLQIAARRGDGAFGAARTPEQLGRPAFGVGAAGDGERTVVVWPAQDGSVRRIQLVALDAAGRASQARWITGPERDATSPAVALGPGGGVAAWVGGMPSGHVTAATLTAGGEPGTAQALDDEPGGAPDVAVGPGGAAVVAWPAGGSLRAALRPAGAAGFSAAVTLPGTNVHGWTAAVTGEGETIVAWLDAPPGTGAREGARLLAAVAPPGDALGAPEELARHVFRLDGAAGELTWVEGRPSGPYEIERRVRYARLAPAAPAGGGDAGGPGAADRRAPRVRMRVLGVRGRRVRVAVRSDERAALRATWRRGSRTIGRAGGTLRAGRTRVLRFRAPAGARRVALAIKVTDAAGNARTARRAIRLRR